MTFEDIARPLVQQLDRFGKPWDARLTWIGWQQRLHLLGAHALIEGDLHQGPPMRFVSMQAAATKEEGCCCASLPKDRRCLPNVLGQVVVERERNWEWFTGSTALTGFEDLTGPNEPVVPLQMFEVGQESRPSDGRHDSASLVSRADAVVDEGDTGGKIRRLQQATQPACERASKMFHPGASRRPNTGPSHDTEHST